MEPPTRTLAFVVEYDGTGFHGFQRQTSDVTVAGELERAFALLFGHPVRVAAAGRTDAGVHATGQVVSCETGSDFPTSKIPMAASALLRAGGIAVLRAVERPAGFSARHHALSRTYRYRILNRAVPSPLMNGKALWVRATLDVNAMRAAARVLLGRHDFVAFSAGPPHERGTIREIRRLDIAHVGDSIDIVIRADSFLHQMVRIIVGTLIEVARGRRPAGDIAQLLAAKNRAHAGFTAPPHALYLEHVEYNPPL